MQAGKLAHQLSSALSVQKPVRLAPLRQYLSYRLAHTQPARTGLCTSKGGVVCTALGVYLDAFGVSFSCG